MCTRSSSQRTINYPLHVWIIQQLYHFTSSAYKMRRWISHTRAALCFIKDTVFLSWSVSDVKQDIFILKAQAVTNKITKEKQNKSEPKLSKTDVSETTEYQMWRKKKNGQRLHVFRTSDDVIWSRLTIITPSIAEAIKRQQIHRIWSKYFRLKLVNNFILINQHFVNNLTENQFKYLLEFPTDYGDCFLQRFSVHCQIHDTHSN